MADIELVIKIPERLWTKQLTADDYIEIVNVVANGTVLPKGHGDLKDVDAIMRELSVVSSRPVKSQMYIIRDAPTIIKANRGESDRIGVM